MFPDFFRRWAPVGVLVLAGVCASPASAQTSVYSNIVGFNRLDVPADGLALVSTPFIGVTNASVQEVIGPQLTGGTSIGTADRILFWDAQENEFIRLWQLSSTNPDYDGKWIDDKAGAFATNEVNPGAGFWIQSIHSSNQAVYVVGDVVTNEVVSMTVNPGLQLVAYPFSADILLNSTGLTNGLAGASYLEADHISMWDPDAQVFKRFWLLASTNPLYNRRWIDDAQSIFATNLVHTGEGFWYERTAGTSFEWVESRPYPVP